MPLEPLKTRSSPRATVCGHMLLIGAIVTLIPFNMLQTLSLALRPFSRRIFRVFNCWCAGTWWGWCVTCAEKLHGTRIHITGDEPPMRENALLVANHQDMPDIPAMMKFCRTRGRLGDMKYFVKKQLKWVPGMGWGMQFIDCLFIDRDWATDKAKILQTFARLVDAQVPVHLVSFVEGTRFTMAKHARAQDFARSRGLHIPRHLLVPRTKGFAASVEGLRTHITAVYDLTIGYEHGVPNLWHYLTGLVTEIHVHVRRFPIGDLPEEPEEIQRWLHDRWTEKDGILERFYSTGAFEISISRNIST